MKIIKGKDLKVGDRIAMFYNGAGPVEMPTITRIEYFSNTLLNSREQAELKLNDKEYTIINLDTEYLTL